MIDLRSDTVTRPTPEMLEAMMAAKVGDDVFAEDPTVNELQAKIAGMFGKEDAVFCPSGTMANQLAINIQTSDLEEIVCEETAHINTAETGAYAYVSRVAIKTLPGDRGRIKAPQIAECINPEFDWLPKTSFASIENTSNHGGGSYYSLEEMLAISNTCRKAEVALHLDGARLFNALVASGIKTAEVGPLFDTISICLSKGLGAPAGTMLMGTRVMMKKARRLRKALGGTMRQTGILAAAGIYALDHNVERLSDDHKRASAIGEALKSCSFVDQQLPVDTNIVIFKLNEKYSTATFLSKLKDQGVLAVPFGPGVIRMVTHLDISDEQTDQVTEALIGL